MEKVTSVEQLVDIFDQTNSKWEGDNAYQGLIILSKYTDNLIQGADHDIIYGEDLEKVIEAGLTVQDATELARLNWMLQDEICFACYV